MTAASPAILKLLHETRAVHIWDRKHGPVFWYAAGVPGPFYVNTEQLIGAAAASRILNDINAILASTTDNKKRAEALTAAIMTEYNISSDYQMVIAELANLTHQELLGDIYPFISGGERRDWFFSIPLAQHLKLKHIFLFKDGSAWCESPWQRGDHVLHVSDLINNAASLGIWLTSLQREGLNCPATVCVNSRGVGKKKLEDAGINVIVLNEIGAEFFAKWQSSGLIDKGTLEEIETYYRSPAEWGKKYLTCDINVFNIKGLDEKSLKRLKDFFAKDPWGLRPEHEDFFQQMERAVAAKG